jgi:hypothetical protein
MTENSLKSDEPRKSSEVADTQKNNASNIKEQTEQKDEKEFTDLVNQLNTNITKFKN